MALPRPREGRWRYLGALLSPTPRPPLLPSRGQSAVEFLLAGSRILGCPKRTPSTRARCPGALRLRLDCRSRYGRALATGTEWAGLCLIHHHHQHRAHLIYGRIFARSRTRKCAKLVLGTSAVHVSTCAHDYVLAFLASAPQNSPRNGKFSSS